MTWKEWFTDTTYRWHKWAVGWLHLGPHFVVGDSDNPYLYRWYVIPRFDFLSIYVHKFLRDDDDRALHDHPWKSVSFLFRGRYIEVTSDGKEREFSAPAIIWRTASDPHRIKLIDGKPAWTLFFAGRRERDWGFWCNGGRWVHWKEFVTVTPNGNKNGKGCEES